MALINDFLSLIYPRHCEACGDMLYQHESFICNYCVLSLPKYSSQASAQDQLNQVFAGRIPLVAASSYYTYEKKGRVQKLLHAIKYQDQKELAEHIGNLFAGDTEKSKECQDIDLVMPVPLHHNKQKQRGYNQSEWFAKGISTGIKKPLDTSSLSRVVETSTQTRKKKYQRWENVEGIFELRTPQNLVNKHILLVDDVITTGATIEAAWQALKQVQGARLSVASIAFAIKF